MWQPCELLYTCYLLLVTCCSTQLCCGAAAHHRGRQSRQDTGRGRRSSRRRQRSVHSTSPRSIARVRLRYCSIHSSSPVQLFELVVASQDAASVDDDAAVLGSTETRAAAMRPPAAITVARVDENLFCWHFRLDDNSKAEIFSYQ